VDEIGVLPSVEVKSLKAKLKEAKAQCKLAKREKHDAEEFEALIRSVENRLIRHKAFTDEAKRLKLTPRNRKEKRGARSSCPRKD